MPIEYLTSQVIAHINDRFDDLESLKLSHNGLLMAIVYSVMVGKIFHNCMHTILIPGIKRIGDLKALISLKALDLSHNSLLGYA